MGKPAEYYGEIRAKTESSADLYFYGDIVSSWWGAWDDEDQWPDKVRQFLDEIKGIPNLNIYINSGGGSCYAGMAIYNMLRRHKAHKTVYVDGLAASMASILALCGDSVVVPANAWMMIHQPWTFAWGNADEMAKEISVLRALEEGLLNAYCEHLRPGVTREQIYDMMKAETWLTGEEAANYFNVETLPVNNAAAWVGSEHYARYKNMPEGVEINDISKTPSLVKPPDRPAQSSELAKAKLRLNLSLSRRKP